MIEVKVDDLTGSEIQSLLMLHLRSMREVSPPESVHALDLDELRQPGITFWSIWNGRELAGCIALKELNAQHGEIKSMRTVENVHGKGFASQLLRHLIEEAKRRGYCRLSLETGSMPYFLPARKLYEKFGFKACGPFEDYTEDPNSIFMTLSLLPDFESDSPGVNPLQH